MSQITSMDTEVVIDSFDGTRVYVETGVEDGDNIIDLHVEDNDNAVDVRLSVAEALVLIEALSRAARTALANGTEATDYNPADDGADPDCTACLHDGIACDEHAST